MTIEDDILALQARLTRAMTFEAGGTVELVDDDDPDGMVVFKDKAGRPQMWMPVKTYWALMESSEGK